jgi:hypothetical protein
MRLEFGNRNRLKPSLGSSIRHAHQIPQSPRRSRRLRTWRPFLQRPRALPRTSARVANLPIAWPASSPRSLSKR